MAKDLICGMDVDERTAKYQTVYQGKTYFFCCPKCKKSFDEEPELYIFGEKSDDQNHKHHHAYEGEEPSDSSCGCGCGHHH